MDKYLDQKKVNAKRVCIKSQSILTKKINNIRVKIFE